MKRICALFLLLMLLLSACSAEAAVPSAPELIEPVQAQPKTATVHRGDLLNATTTVGNIALYCEPVAFITDGTLEELKVIPGQAVKAGDILATLNTQSLQTRLDNLQEQQSRTGYTNALTNENLQLGIDICRLKLDQLTAAQEEALQSHTAAITSLESALAQLQQANDASIAALEKQLAEYQEKLSAPETAPAEAELLKSQINVLQGQINTHRLSTESSAADTAAQIEGLQAQIDTLKGQQALQKKLYELDLQDAELALKHAKQAQALAAKKVTTQIELLQSSIDKAVITAPIDGIITWISSDTKITAEESFIYIAVPGKYYVRTEELSDKKLADAQEIYALIGNQKYPLTYRPQPITERLHNSLSGIPVYSFYDFEADAQVPESMNALVFCVHASRKDVLTVPTSALNRDNAGYFVYRMTDGQKEMVHIKLGISTGLQAEVLSGLEEGDVVYVAD